MKTAFALRFIYPSATLFSFDVVVFRLVRLGFASGVGCLLSVVCWCRVPHTKPHHNQFMYAEFMYDAAMQALKGTGKGGKTSKGETRKVFTKDEPTNVDVDKSGKASAKGSGDASGGNDVDAAAQVGTRQEAGGKSGYHTT